MGGPRQRRHHAVGHHADGWLFRRVESDDVVHSVDDQHADFSDAVTILGFIELMG